MGGIVALITCEDCGKEYSDKAAACINCGCPNPLFEKVSISPVLHEQPATKKKSGFMFYLKLFVVLCIGATIIELTSSNDKVPITTNKKVTHFSHPLVESGVGENGISDGLKENPIAINQLVNVIRTYGYKCDSISGAYEMVFSRGFKVNCNHNTYMYLVEDKGGTFVATLR